MNEDAAGTWRGVIPPLVTPLLERDVLDGEGIDGLVEHVIAGGVHGVFVLGSTGEAPSLSHRLRRELVERVTARVAGRVPVMVGITDTSFTDAVSLAEHAAACGADAVVVAPPYYFPAGQPELVEYVTHLVERLPLPLFLYNMPAYTKVSFAPETVRELAGLPGVAGIKDSSGSMIYFHRLVSLLGERDDFRIFIGPEVLLGEAVLMGAHGGVCGGANLDPALYVRLYEAAAASRHGEMRRLHARVMRISETLYRIGSHPSGHLKGLKCALMCLGICNDFMAEPFHRFREPERERVRQVLRELGYPA